MTDYPYTSFELITIRESGLTLEQVDAVIEQFTNKGLMPVDCAMDYLKRQERGEDTTAFLQMVEDNTALALANGVSLTPYLDVIAAEAGGNAANPTGGTGDNLEYFNP